MRWKLQKKKKMRFIWRKVCKRDKKFTSVRVKYQRKLSLIDVTKLTKIHNNEEKIEKSYHSLLFWTVFHTFQSFPQSSWFRWNNNLTDVSVQIVSRNVFHLSFIFFSRNDCKSLTSRSVFWIVDLFWYWRIKSSTKPASTNLVEVDVAKKAEQSYPTVFAPVT